MTKDYAQYKFEKLDVWQESLNFAQQCHEICRKFPAYERDGLGEQLRRA